MSEAPKSKATAITSPQFDRAIEEHYASHKKSQNIKKQLDRLHSKDLNNQTEIASRLRRRVSHDTEAGRFQKLADEQTKKSKALQKEVDEMKEKWEKEFTRAKNELQERQTASEAPLLRAKRRLYADLGKSLEGTMYGRVTASDPDSSSDRDDALPPARPKKSPPLDTARKRRGKVVRSPRKEERDVRSEPIVLENSDGYESPQM